MAKWEYLDFGVSEINDKIITLHPPKNFDINAFIQLLKQKPVSTTYDESWDSTKIRFSGAKETIRAYHEMIDLLGADSWEAYKAEGAFGRYFKRILKE